MVNENGMIPFSKDHGSIGEWSNVIESTYDLLNIQNYCLASEMNYTPETKQPIQKLIDWLTEAADCEGKLTTASKL